MDFLQKLAVLGGGSDHSEDESPANYHHIIDVNGKKKVVDDMTLDSITNNLNNVEAQIGQNRGEWVEHALRYSNWRYAWYGATLLTLGSLASNLLESAIQPLAPTLALYGVFSGVCAIVTYFENKQMQEYDEEYDDLVERRDTESIKYAVQQQAIAQDMQTREKSLEVNPYR